jgi:hypothetical protein
MIIKDMDILDIVDAHPETEDVFRSYDAIAGECIMCKHLFETVEEFTRIYNLNLDEMLEKLNSVK